jgi:hypothetical protein
MFRLLTRLSLNEAVRHQHGDIMTLRSCAGILALLVGFGVTALQPSPSGLVSNGLSANGLSANGLSANGLSANGRTSQGAQLKAVILRDGSVIVLR